MKTKYTIILILALILLSPLTSAFSYPGYFEKYKNKDLIEWEKNITPQISEEDYEEFETIDDYKGKIYTYNFKEFKEGIPKKTHIFWLRWQKECGLYDDEYGIGVKLKESENYSYYKILVESTKIDDLVKDECVINLADIHGLGVFEKEIKKELIKERNRLFEEKKLWETHKDLTSKKEAQEQAEKMMLQKGKELKEDQISWLQLFIPFEEEIEIPGNVEEIYVEAVEWVWISDWDLWREEEHWMTVEDFLTLTPDMLLNPSRKIASDCSEQANTLVYKLREAGVPAEDVRVVLGRVQFGDTIGGHAWVEIKIDEDWIQLEPTSGPYIKENVVIEREGLPFTYFKDYPYPIVEVWCYYNDVYYQDASGSNVNWEDDVAFVFEKEIKISFVDKIQNFVQNFINNIRDFLFP